MPPTQGQQALEHPLQEQLQPNMLVLTATMIQRAFVLGSCCHLQHTPAVTKCLGYSVHCPNHPPNRKLPHIWLPEPLSGPHYVSYYHCLPLHCPTSEPFVYTLPPLQPERPGYICGWAKKVRMEMSSLPASIFKVLRKWAPM